MWQKNNFINFLLKNYIFYRFIHFQWILAIYEVLFYIFFLKYTHWRLQEKILNKYIGAKLNYGERLFILQAYLEKFFNTK